jgi:beta-N-acetylhexosaminidase
LLETDFAPFRALADLPIGMTAHIVVPAYDARNPATCSTAVIDVIRNVIGFGGLLLTDDISMQALSGTVPERAGRAIGAGCDVVLHCNAPLAEKMAVAAAVGPMTPKAQHRARVALLRRSRPGAIDAKALLAELEGLLMAESPGARHG